MAGYSSIWICGWNRHGDVGAEPGGDEIRFYHNQKDGTFKDVTDQLSPAAQEILTSLGLEIQGNIGRRFHSLGYGEFSDDGYGL